MHIKDKVLLDRPGLEEHGPITIVAFGDSVTHGCFAIDEFDYEHTYWNILKRKIQTAYPYIPVNVINAGIGGYRASNSIARMDKHVLSHNPDLIIVCFGLNDVQQELETYIRSLRTIFEKAQNHGSDCIFLTPNMLCTYVAEDVAPPHVNIATRLADIQNSGRMDTYMQSAVALAKEMHIPVCDCYAKWKEWSKTKDTTKLLSNRVNHPNQEMHAVFADELYKLIFPEEQSVNVNDSMYYGK